MLLSVKRPSFGIRPPGAPTSIRPPRSAHGVSGSSLFRRPGRAMPQADWAAPQPDWVAPQPDWAAPQADWAAPTDDSHPAEPEPASKPPRRPRSGSSPSEPPPARRPPQKPPWKPRHRPSRAGGEPRDFDWGPAILTTSVALIVIGLVLVGSLDNSGKRSTTGSPRPTRAASAPRSSASARTATAAPTSSDAANDSWTQAWSIDLESGDNAGVRTYVSGDHLVVYDQAAGTRQQLRGYSLADGRPRELWSVAPEERPVAVTSTVLVSSRSLIDPATGEATDAPWDRSSEPVLVTDDLIITCAKKPSPTCTGWDLADKTLTQRWGPVAFPENDLLLFSQYATTGDTRTGYALATTRDSNASAASAYFVSLADGSIQNTRPEKKDGRFLNLVPAADGWLQLEAGQKSITALEPDGTERETYTPSRKRPMLLLTDSGLPTLDQYRSAFTSGDTSWASVALDCQFRGRACTLNGRALAGEDDGMTILLMHEGGFTATMNERYLILSQGSGSDSVSIIDREQMSLGPRGDSLFGARAPVAVARADLLIAVKDSSLVGYAPAG